MSRNLFPLVLMAVFLFTGCEPRSYAVLVNDHRITPEDIRTLAQNWEILQPDFKTQYELQGSNAITQQVSADFTSQAATVQAMRDVLRGRGVDANSRALEKFTRFLERSSGTESKALAEWKKLPRNQRVGFARLWLTRSVFGVLDSGVKPTDSAEVICADVNRFMSREEAQAFANGDTSKNGLGNAQETCLVVRGAPVRQLDEAIRGTRQGTTTGVVEVASQSQLGDTTLFVVARVTQRSLLAFRDWPLSALQEYASEQQKLGDLSGEVMKKTKVRVNPSFGSLNDGPCQATLICVLPPEVPKLAHQRELPAE